jgi:hypothetical protein
MYHAPVPTDAEPEQPETAASEPDGYETGSERLRQAHLQNGQAAARALFAPYFSITAVLAAASTLVALLNSSLDLAERLDRPAESPAPPLAGAVDQQPGRGPLDDRLIWNNSAAACDNDWVTPLTRRAAVDDVGFAGDGALVGDVTDEPGYSMSPWVLDTVYDVPEAEFDFHEFVRAGAVSTESGDIDLLLFNRGEQGDLIVTDISYVIDREPDPTWRPPGGTARMPPCARRPAAAGTTGWPCSTGGARPSASTARSSTG